jgi:hypothetical protein
MNTTAYCKGWERIFKKSPPQIISNPFQLRPDVVIRYEVPVDFTKRDLQRLVRHLGTMCEDWEPEEGLAVVSFHGDAP